MLGTPFSLGKPDEDSDQPLSPMATATLFFLLILGTASATNTPYLFPTTLPKDYQNMLKKFKIFIYTTPADSKPLDFSGAASLFYNSLLHSRFLTQDPAVADLFFVPFSPDTSTRSLARLVGALRGTYPYWNRTLGADHFFLSPAGIDFSSDRNVLELKKNSVQISVFPVVSGLFIPHKDIALPPIKPSPSPLALPIQNFTTLGYLRLDETQTAEPNLVNELKAHPDFLVEEKSQPLNRIQPVKKSRFCLFLYHGDVAWLAEAMARGCVPVVIVDRPIQDLPSMDVLRWSDLALLVAAPRGGGSDGAERLKRMLNGVSEEKYATMREMCMAASKHLVWTEEIESQPLDAFHMVMYQLWRRRHVVRYARREFV